MQKRNLYVEMRLLAEEQYAQRHRDYLAVEREQEGLEAGQQQER